MNKIAALFYPVQIKAGENEFVVSTEGTAGPQIFAIPPGKYWPIIGGAPSGYPSLFSVIKDLLSNATPGITFNFEVATPRNAELAFGGVRLVPTNNTEWTWYPADVSWTLDPALLGLDPASHPAGLYGNDADGLVSDVSCYGRWQTSDGMVALSMQPDTHPTIYSSGGARSHEHRIAGIPDWSSRDFIMNFIPTQYAFERVSAELADGLADPNNAFEQVRREALADVILATYDLESDGLVPLNSDSAEAARLGDINKSIRAILQPTSGGSWWGLNTRLEIIGQRAIV